MTKYFLNPPLFRTFIKIRQQLARQLAEDEMIQPDIEITSVIKRLAAICRGEGDDLLADNILLQSQRLGEEARKLISQQRVREADKIIVRYQWIGAGVIACKH